MQLGFLINFILVISCLIPLYNNKLLDNEFLNIAEDYWDDHFPDIIEEVKEI